MINIFHSLYFIIYKNNIINIILKKLIYKNIENHKNNNRCISY
uniref:Uncharacterized protein n=1 Tax=Geladintestivirus 1 TaxID=3233133 RepID=A0AAU8MKS7_9CAUD